MSSFLGGGGGGGGGSSLTIGVTTITGGTDGGVLYDSGPGILEESSTFTFLSGTLGVPSITTTGNVNVGDNYPGYVVISGGPTGGTVGSHSGGLALAPAGSTELDYGITNASKWTFAANIVVTPFSTAGIVVNDSSGNLTSETLSAAIDAAFGSAQGDILYRGASTWTVLAPGTSGNFLQTQGAAANPIWAAGGGGGSLTVGTTTISGGTAGGILWDSGPGTLEESSNFTWNNSTQAILVSAGTIDTRGGQGVTVTAPPDSGNNSVAVGRAGLRNQSGSFSYNNIAIGTALYGGITSSGTDNVGIGNNALAAITSGNSNVAIGSNAAKTLSTGSSNFALGFGALSAETIGGDNVAIGVSAAGGQIGVTNTIAIGNSALPGSLTGSNNIGIGASTGNSLTSGNQNTIIGNLSFEAETTGINNTAIGYNALNTITGGGSNNTAIGVQAAHNITSSSSNNTFIGGYLGPSSTVNNQIIISDGAANLGFVWDNTNDNLWGGASAGNYGTVTGTQNTGLGWKALTALTTGGTNTCIGYEAGDAITTGSYNTIVGSYVGTTALANAVVLADGQANLRFDYGVTAGSTITLTGATNITGTVHAGTGSTDYVTLAGGSSGATIGSSGGTLTISPAGTNELDYGVTNGTAWTMAEPLFMASGKGITLAAANIATDTTTGTEIATATTQKLGFYGKTPIVQPTEPTTPTTFTITTNATTTTPWGFATSTQANHIAAQVSSNSAAIASLITNLHNLGLSS